MLQYDARHRCVQGVCRVCVAMRVAERVAVCVAECVAVRVAV